MALFGGEAAVPAAATNITTLLSLARTLHCKQIVIKNIEGAANNLFIGRSNVTTGANRHHSLAAGAAVTLGGGDWKCLNTDEVYVIGTAAGGNIVLFTLIE